MTTDLNEMAERVERATADEQRAVIEQAAAGMAFRRLWPPHADDTELVSRFYALLNAGAYLDAALSLAIRPDHGEPDFDLSRGVAGWDCNVSLKELWVPDGRSQGAKTPALALTAAALRAIATQEQSNDQS